ncbi:bifunctional diaminohydroxyphosphoribosylaminopyrimidine deaminase/5-amino-6-(5-phosphoribosylamino)uracil reductase RibD [Brucella intermedia]|uniref:bifunctional diaminohydroxyphosphoribosylaminopyrimidine deaminase/5-amino-6-(5-phosphoribosylamino)uracil reductase RibD n=1 Tax=Brucella intermedia TaxID=94625 RepID=UPI00224944B2|nr:bifunctional diaminohydroxyphosphoribosylaminopyrimidine deaminase/5-amino-6-(5-phosphoribosylamino)uracil reductase RibD [Brucella intermedia]
MHDSDDAWSDRSAHGDDAGWMREAIVLARAVRGWVWPNPPVGCVIVRDGNLIGRGRTQFGGRPHAERVALDDAGDQAEGGTLYVTLEPCCHWGKTPPCADAIIEAGIRKVFASLQDPDPRVNGGGLRKLREAGVEVEVGLGKIEAGQIMAGFFHRIATGQPIVTIGDLSEDLSLIPDGYDAVLRSGPDRLWLSTRAQDVGVLVRQVRDPGEPFGRLLSELGEMGLTNVFIPSCDLIVPRLATVQNRGTECHAPGPVVR